MRCGRGYPLAGQRGEGMADVKHIFPKPDVREWEEKNGQMETKIPADDRGGHGGCAYDEQLRLHPRCAGTGRYVSEPEYADGQQL